VVAGRKVKMDQAAARAAAAVHKAGQAAAEHQGKEMLAQAVAQRILVVVAAVRVLAEDRRAVLVSQAQSPDRLHIMPVVVVARIAYPVQQLMQAV
jgi:hypothetical protein